jgi:MFS family permease
MLAFIFRMITLGILARQYEPHLKIEKKQKGSLKDFIKSCPKTPFGKFIIFVTLFNLVSAIATPFFVVYFLEELGLSYIWYVLIIIVGILFELAFLPLMGKISDKYGNVALLKFSSFFIAIKPLIILIAMFLSDNLIFTKIFLLVLFGLSFGLSTGGWNISNTNYIYDSTEVSKRNYAISYKNLLSGIAIFIGALIGSGLALLSPSWGSGLILIFGISFVLRILVSILGLRNLKEVKKVKRFNSRIFFHEMGSFSHENHQIHHLDHPGTKIIHHH